MVAFYLGDFMPIKLIRLTEEDFSDKEEFIRLSDGCPEVLAFLNERGEIKVWEGCKLLNDILTQQCLRRIEKEN